MRFLGGSAYSSNILLIELPLFKSTATVGSSNLEVTNKYFKSIWGLLPAVERRWLSHMAGQGNKTSGNK